MPQVVIGDQQVR